MAKPSLMEIAFNWSVAKYNYNTGKTSLIGARTLVSAQIESALNTHSHYVAYIRYYIGKVANDTNIKIIKLNYEKGIGGTISKETYQSFSHTPLYARLKALEDKQISLKDICTEANIVRDEIILAVIGFEQEVRNYDIKGVASYPCYSLKIYPFPVSEMNMNVILDLKGKSDSKKAQYKKIQAQTKKELDCSITETLQAMLEYFSAILRDCNNEKDVFSTLTWINKYIIVNVDSKLQTQLNLKTLLQFTPVHSEHSMNNFKILYNTYGKQVYNIPLINDMIFQMKQFIVNSLDFENIIGDIFTLQKLGMLPEILSTIYIYNNKKISFLEGAFSYGKEIFCCILNMIPGQMLWHTLNMPYDLEKGISIVQNIAQNPEAKSIFKFIVEKCDIKILPQIANIVINNDQNVSAVMCIVLDDKDFAKIVLERLSEKGLWDELHNLKDYFRCAYDMDPPKDYVDHLGVAEQNLS